MADGKTIFTCNNLVVHLLVSLHVFYLFSMNSIALCPVHEIKCSNYCPTCGSVKCQRCPRTKGHEWETIDGFYDANKSTLPTMEELPSFLPQVEEAIKGIEAKAVGKKEDYNSKRSRTERMKEQLDNPAQTCEDDISLATKATDILLDLEKEAHTEVLKDRMTKARMLLAVGDEIKQEVDSLKENFDRLTQEAEALRVEINRIDLDLARLHVAESAIKETEQKETEQNIKQTQLLSFLFLFRDGVIGRTTVNVKEECFEAFYCVDKVFDVKSAMGQKMFKIGKALKIGKPITVKQNLLSGEYIFASVSHKGVLSIYSRTDGDFVEFNDLVKDKQVEVEVESETLVGYYDDKIVVLTDNKQLRECEVSKVFEERSFSILETICGSGEVNCYADVTRLNSTRKLYYTTISCKPYEYDVDTKTNTKLGIGKRVWSFGSLTGIKTDVRAVFRDRGGEHLTYVLNDDYTTTPIFEYDPGAWLTTVFPSLSEPNNTSKSVKLYCDAVLYTEAGDGIEFKKPFEYQGYYSVVRLYRDVFLVYDNRLRGWYLSRISVL